MTPSSSKCRFEMHPKLTGGCCCIGRPAIQAAFINFPTSLFIEEDHIGRKLEEYTYKTLLFNTTSTTNLRRYCTEQVTWSCFAAIKLLTCRRLTSRRHLMPLRRVVLPFFTRCGRQTGEILESLAVCVNHAEKLDLI